MRRFLMLGLVFWGCLVSARATESLSNVVDAIMARNGQLQTAQAYLSETRDAVSAARARRYPGLSIRSSVMRGDNPVYVFGSLLEQQSFGPQNFAIDSLNNPDYHTNFKNTLDVGFPLFTAFQNSSEIDMRRIANKQAIAQWAVVEQQVRFQAINTYLRLLLKKGIVEKLSERIRSSEQEIESARKLNMRGLVLGSDFYAAQAVLSALKGQKIQAERELKAAVSGLLIMMGRADPGLEPHGHLKPAAYSVPSESELLSKAMAGRWEIRQAELQCSMAETRMKQSGRSFLPIIDAYASVETNTEDFSSNPTSRMVGVKSTFPIGDPTYFSRKATAKSQVSLAQAHQASAAEIVRLDVVNAYAGYSGPAEALPIVQEMLVQAQKSLDLFRPLYREGRQSILDVLRAEDSLFRAEQALLETAYHLHSGFARVALAIGALDAAVVNEIAGEIGAQP